MSLLHLSPVWQNASECPCVRPACTTFHNNLFALHPRAPDRPQMDGASSTWKISLISR